MIGATTLLVEQKFIHSGGKAGHIEDVVTRKGFEGLGIGSALINMHCILQRQLVATRSFWIVQTLTSVFIRKQVLRYMKLP